MNSKNILSVFGLTYLIFCAFTHYVCAESFDASFGNTTYFVDNQNGDDDYSGLSPGSAWKSLEKVSRTTFQPGDSILFKRNGVWNGQLWPRGSGEENVPIVIDAYGEGVKPLFNGGGANYVVMLYNQEYWIINNLEITNYNYDYPDSYKRGVYIKATNIGEVNSIQLLNLDIHDINGSIASGNTSKNNGGIFFEITGSTTPTYFRDVLIEKCHIYDVDRTGISLASEWDTRTIDTNTDWTPSLNIVIRNNMIERTGGNGLIWRVSHRPLVEYNVFCECATKLSGNAMFFFNCDSATAQFNEAYLTVYAPGETDAGAFDADYRCKNTIYQYNYSHDNGEAAFVAPSNGTSSTAFQDGAVFRYNISQNDKREVFHVSGPITNTTFYNNTVYLGSHLSDIIIIYHKSWGGYPDRTSYYNNIIYNQASSTRYSFGSSTNNIFYYNVFYGNHSSSEPSDPHKIKSDPMLVDPGSAGLGINTVDGYKLKPGSPCIDSGKFIEGSGGRDYWGGQVPYNSTDRGAHEYGSTIDVSSFDEDSHLPKNFVLHQNFPNPFNCSTNIRFDLKQDAHVNLSIYTIDGKHVFTLLDHSLKKGTYSHVWNGTSYDNSTVTSGIYLAKIEANHRSETIKMLLVK